MGSGGVVGRRSLIVPDEGFLGRVVVAVRVVGLGVTFYAGGVLHVPRRSGRGPLGGDALLFTLARVFLLTVPHERRDGGDGLRTVDDEVTKNRIVEAKRFFQRFQGGLVALDVEERVVGLVQFVDAVGQLAPTPVLAAVDDPRSVLDQAPVTLEHAGNLLALVGVGEKNDFVVAHRAWNLSDKRPPAERGEARRLDGRGRPFPGSRPTRNPWIIADRPGGDPLVATHTHREDSGTVVPSSCRLNAGDGRWSPPHERSTFLPLPRAEEASESRGRPTV